MQLTGAYWCVLLAYLATPQLLQHYYTSLVRMHPNYALRQATKPLPTAFPAIMTSNGPRSDCEL